MLGMEGESRLNALEMEMDGIKGNAGVGVPPVLRLRPRGPRTLSFSQLAKVTNLVPK